LIHPVLKWTSAVAAAVLGLALAVIGFLWLVPRGVPPGQPPLATLNAASLPAFRAAFDAPGDEIRVLAMLSPT
jgi:hypothetical protein